MAQLTSFAQFLSGASMLAALAIALFFLRFWKSTSDRLFLMFSGAFWLFSLERMILIFMQQMDEMRPYTFLVRLVAFLIIIGAILDKNFSNSKS